MWSRANYKGGERVASSSGKRFLLGKWGQNSEKGPRHGLRWAQDRASQQPLLGHGPASGPQSLCFPRPAGVRNAEGLKGGRKGGDLLNNQSGQGQCPAAPPDFSPQLSPVSPVQSHSPRRTPCVCSDHSGCARALGAHVGRIEIDWVDGMLRDRIQSKLQLNLPGLDLLIRKGCAEVGHLQSAFTGSVQFDRMYLRTSRGRGQQSRLKQPFPVLGAPLAVNQPALSFGITPRCPGLGCSQSSPGLSQSA